MFQIKNFKNFFLVLMIKKEKTFLCENACFILCENAWFLWLKLKKQRNLILKGLVHRSLRNWFQENFLHFLKR